ncbi:MAG TPA: hypothetical protein VK255_00325 [Patescibacteria group bacterium]|nr:hypothetical protein [Patescibacteria group bacterium]
MWVRLPLPAHITFKFMQLLAVILAGVSVASADVLIKKVSLVGSFWAAFKNPLVIAIVIFYLAQIGFFVYVFMHHWKLGVVGNLQMLFYSLSVVLMGYFFFKEDLSLIQAVGIGLALIAVFLINK